MAYILRPSKHVGRDVRRAARDPLDEALARLDHLDGCAAEEIEEQVHEIRKRCKEARGLARLVRPALGKEFRRFNDRVRDAAAELSSIRDAHAVLNTLDHLRATSHAGPDPTFESVRASQADLAAEATLALRPGDPRLVDARRLLAAARRDVKRWDLPRGFAAVGPGLEDTYRRGRRALRDASEAPTDEQVHEWRKAVKQLWYQIRLLGPAAPSVLGPLAASLDRVADALGDDHDLAVLLERLAADPERFGGAESVADVATSARRQQDDLRGRAFRLAATIYAEPPRVFVARVEGYWRITLGHGPERTAGGIGALLADLERAPDDPLDATGAGGLERERKFLVTAAPEFPAGADFRQGYIAVDGDASVRVRDAGVAGCTLTIKVGAGAVRLEQEWAISRSRFDDFWAQTTGRRVTKTRSEVPLGEHTAEVDVFHDDLTGLVVAEVEFDDDAAMAAFTPPKWFGPEVSDDLRYTNASLAVHGLDRRLFTRPSSR